MAKFMKAAGAVLCFAALAAAAEPATRIERVAPNLYRAGGTKVGAWEITRYTRDAAGKVPGFCTAIVITGSEQALRVEKNDKTTSYSFMGEASAAMGNTVKVSYWFDGRRDAAKTTTFKLTISAEEGIEWLGYTELNEEPGDEELYMNSKAVHFGYRHEGKPIVQTIPLAGSKAALEKLFACK